MRLPALKHLLEAVQALGQSEQIRVLGSSALLASFPELGEPGGPLELSFDADLLVTPCDEQLAATIHEAVGEGSLFAQRMGYHADVLRPTITETLCPGWAGRVIELATTGDVAALSAEDVIVAKLRLGRTKDLELCRHLIRYKLVVPEPVEKLLEATPMREAELVRVHARFHEIAGREHD